jgi:hypothetical protein
VKLPEGKIMIDAPMEQLACSYTASIQPGISAALHPTLAVQ